MITLFNLSEAATIALHSLAIIANSKDTVNVNDLGDLTKFSRNHLAKVLNVLAKNNYLTSLRGPSGGYSLSEKAADVSLYEILNVVEGNVEQFECTITCKECYFDGCLFGDQPNEFTSNFIKYLKEKTISDFKLKN